MTRTSAIITYVLIVMLFSALFRYGFNISFNIDTGYIGPIFLWHSFLLIGMLFKETSKK